VTSVLSIRELSLVVKPPDPFLSFSFTHFSVSSLLSLALSSMGSRRRHSDSMDSDSYRDSQLAAFKAGAATGEIPGSDAAGAEPAAKKAWSYVRVSGLGLLRGLCCPHYDRVQSNGVPRAVDLEAMLLRHKGESDAIQVL